MKNCDPSYFLFVKLKTNLWTSFTIFIQSVMDSGINMALWQSTVKYDFKWQLQNNCIDSSKKYYLCFAKGILVYWGICIFLFINNLGYYHIIFYQKYASGSFFWEVQGKVFKLLCVVLSMKFINYYNFGSYGALF